MKFSSRTTPSTTGIVRLGNAESVGWRNAANSADLLLTVTSGNLLQFNSVNVLTASSSDTVLSKTFDDSSTYWVDSDDATKQVRALINSAQSGSSSISITFPSAAGTLATLALAETFTNKTLTAPIIATISNTGTLTLPTSTDTLVGKATTDTLTNKTLTAATIVTDAKFSNEAIAKFYEASGTGTNYIGLKAPAAVTADKTFVLPDGDGAANQVLKTDGSANLGWATVATTVTTTRGDVIKRGAAADERLAIGAADKVLVSDGTDPSWGLTVKSGTYTATLTNASNCSVLTFNKANYLRVGNVVHVSVYATITTTAAAPTNSYFYVSLPVASNLAVTGDLIGSGTRYRSGNTAKEAVGIEADTAGDRAICYFGSTETTAADIYLCFSYEVL